MEILFLVLTAISLLAYWKGKNKWGKPLLLLALSFLVLHSALEGYRWQMFFGYLAVAMGLLLLLWVPAKRFIRYSLISLGLCLVMVSAVIGYLIPVFEFPEPGGPYSVGLKPLYLEDTARPDFISKEKGDYRKLVLNIYYPSDKEIVSPQSYLDEGYNVAFARSLGMPELIFSHLPRVESPIQENLPVTARQELPAIILSHGLGWNSELYTSLIQELVSQGYVIIGVEHTYENALTLYDGKRIPQNRAIMDAMDENLNLDRFQVLLDEFREEEDSVQKLKQMRAMVDTLPYNESFARWSADIIFAMDELERLNVEESSFLFGKINTNHIGLLGHSWGGAAVVQAASQDSRAKAVINMEGAQWGQLIDTTLHIPLLSVLADRNYEDFFTPNVYIYDQVTKDNYYQVIIRETGHASFGDIPYWAQLPQLTDAGTIDPERMTRLTTALIMNFFKKHVEQKELDLTRVFNKQEYPELTFEKKK